MNHNERPQSLGERIRRLCRWPTNPTPPQPDVGNAIDALKAAAATDLYNRAAREVDAGRFESAVALYDRVLELSPGWGEAWCNRGTPLCRMGRWHEAFGSFQRAARINNSDDRALSNMGVVLTRFGKVEDALVAFDAAVKANPNNGETWKNRGAVLKLAGRIEEALDSFERADSMGFPGMQDMIESCVTLLQE